MNTTLSATDFVRVTAHTAHCFGFRPLDEVKNRAECRSCTDRITHTATAAHRRIDALHGILTTGMCNYFECNMQTINGPVLFYTTNQVPRSGDIAVSLQVFNVPKSIAESLLIQTIQSLLTDLGYSSYSVRVNSLGDTDSVARYIRELTQFMRKRTDQLPAPARELMKQHVFDALMYLIEKDHELTSRSPSPLEHLSDASRKHFREIVEYLDMSDTPYEIDPKLIGHHQCYSDALFAFDLLDESGAAYEMQPLYIRGGRYNTFVSQMTGTDISAAGAVVVLRNKRAPARIPQVRTKRNAPIFVVQLGFGPKIKSLLLIEALKQAGISVYQDIVSDSLSDQLRKAEAQGVRFAVIMGQKEYVEGNVIVRNLEARSQEFIPTDTLPTYLHRAVMR